jgi:hypothetical protein
VNEHPDAIAETARRVAESALAVDGVRALDAGQFGEIATYVPGERISGVRIGPQHGEVHIVTGVARNLREVAEEVRAAAEMLAAMPFVVTVADIHVDLPNHVDRPADANVSGGAEMSGGTGMEER